MAGTTIEMLDGVWRFQFTYKLSSARPPLELHLLMRNGIMGGIASAGVIVSGDASMRPDGSLEFQLFLDCTLADSSIFLISRSGHAVRDDIQFAGILKLDAATKSLTGSFMHGVVSIDTHAQWLAPFPK